MIKRYDMYDRGFDNWEMRERPDGEFVRYEDHKEAVTGGATSGNRRDGCDTVIVGEETIATLRSGEVVILDNVILIPASNLNRMSDLVERLRDEAAKVAIERAAASGKTGISSRDVTGSVISEAANHIVALETQRNWMLDQRLKGDRTKNALLVALKLAKDHAELEDEVLDIVNDAIAAFEGGAA